MSAFCELFKVKINAGKSYYLVSRGKVKNKEREKEWEDIEKAGGQQELRLWDHTQNKGEGAWETVKETRTSTAVRYLGVMIAADRDTHEQTVKVDKMVRKVVERVRQSKCSGGIANYVIRACVGGILNYHAPFTRLSKSHIEAWDKPLPCS